MFAEGLFDPFLQLIPDLSILIDMFISALLYQILEADVEELLPGREKGVKGAATRATGAGKLLSGHGEERADPFWVAADHGYAIELRPHEKLNTLRRVIRYIDPDLRHHAGSHGTQPGWLEPCAEDLVSIAVSCP